MLQFTGKYSVVTNGMSEYRRNGKNANAALLVSVNRWITEVNMCWQGVEFQRKMGAFGISSGCGENYCAPIQKVGEIFCRNSR